MKMASIRTFLVLFVVLLFGQLASLSAQSPLVSNINSRDGMTLNGIWKYVVDPYETGFYDYRRVQRDTKPNPDKSEALFMAYQPQDPSERVEYDFDKADNILVPGDWNSQKEKLFYYEGSLWYYKKFDYSKKTKSKRHFIHFGAVNYESHVYLNGKKLGQHIGGFIPFNFEITGQLKEKDNTLVLKVDNVRKEDAVPTISTDWWNYGGITRDVKIVEVAETFIQDYYIQLADNDPHTLDLKVTLDGAQKANQKVKISIPEIKFSTTLVTDEKGIAQAKVKVKKIKFWSPETPQLYDVIVTQGKESVQERVGFRTLQTEGADIMLNGESVFLRGICIHEENGARGGRAYSREDAQMLLGRAKDLGCNFVRLAHYPHNENMTRVADELGLMVWAEVPVYWTIQWENEATYANAHQQLTDMITRDKNRASIIIWSVANETPVSEARTLFLKNMIETAHSMDSVRLVSAALELHTKPGTENTQEIADPLQEHVDIIAFNQYIGWYWSTPKGCQDMVFNIQYDKPVVISEFGAGALQGKHGKKEERWTEEYQEYLYQETLDMLEKIPQLRGTNPWILNDFRSPRRLLPDIQDGWNRKGIISETGNKKKAYYVLQDYYLKKKNKF